MWKEDKGKVKARSKQGQDKVKERSRKDQGKVKVRSKKHKYNLNYNYNLMGFDAIEINLVSTQKCMTIYHKEMNVTGPGNRDLKLYI